MTFILHWNVRDIWNRFKHNQWPYITDLQRVWDYLHGNRHPAPFTDFSQLIPFVLPLIHPSHFT